MLYERVNLGRNPSDVPSLMFSFLVHKTTPGTVTDSHNVFIAGDSGVRPWITRADVVPTALSVLEL